MSALKKKIEVSAFREIANLVHQSAGLFIGPEKDFLIETRLRRRIELLKIQSFEDYAELIANDTDELQACVEYLVTHKTEWFREIVHFKWLKTELSKIPAGQPRRMNIWSAACSSGQEVYSLLFFLLREGFHHNEIKILGTDISRPILDLALTIQSEPEFRRQFQQLLNHCTDSARVEQELQLSIEKSVKFRIFNLIEDEAQFGVEFDVIFLRNVLIYFDRPTVLQVCRNLSRRLKPGGHLVLGLSESLNNELAEFVSVGSSIYQYKPSGRR